MSGLQQQHANTQTATIGTTHKRKKVSNWASKVHKSSQPQYIMISYRLNTYSIDDFLKRQ